MGEGRRALENLDVTAIDPAFWRGKRVFLTGHTGFKGGWLALWLQRIGAHVHGYALEPPTQPNLFTLAHVADGLTHRIGDVRDLQALRAALESAAPDIVLHLAAQPILRLSYDDPVGTFDTNLMGTVYVLEAARHTPSVKVTLIITTDKCYENHEQTAPYRESDSMGGHDPYSASKGCAELAISAYGRSFFAGSDAVVGSARAGNVIGGGDWAPGRLMTDIIGAVSQDRGPVLRNPQAIRPWQHVLEPLSGYLCAVQYLWANRSAAVESWNFGPDPDSEVPVIDVARRVCGLWGNGLEPEIQPDPRGVHEANTLRLDSTKARVQLGWTPRLTLADALAWSVSWYKAQHAGDDVRRVTMDQIAAYEIT